LSRRTWVFFLTIQTVGEVCLWAAHLFLSAVGPSLLLIGIVLMLPGLLVSVVVVEKLLWMTSITVHQMLILEVPVAVAINAAVWLALVRLYRVLPRRR